MLLLGILSLVVVDYLQLLVPEFYKMVVNGLNTGMAEVLCEFANELEKADLIVRKKVIFNGANRILVKIPLFGKANVQPTEN